MCVLWRLASKIVACENKLAKVCQGDSRKPLIGLHEKTGLLCEKFAIGS